MSEQLIAARSVCIKLDCLFVVYYGYIWHRKALNHACYQQTTPTFVRTLRGLEIYHRELELDGQALMDNTGCFWEVGAKRVPSTIHNSARRKSPRDALTLISGWNFRSVNLMIWQLWEPPEAPFCLHIKWSFSEAVNHIFLCTPPDKWSSLKRKGRRLCSSPPSFPVGHSICTFVGLSTWGLAPWARHGSGGPSPHFIRWTPEAHNRSKWPDQGEASTGDRNPEILALTPSSYTQSTRATRSGVGIWPEVKKSGFHSWFPLSAVKMWPFTNHLWRLLPPLKWGCLSPRTQWGYTQIGRHISEDWCWMDRKYLPRCH